MILPRQIHIFLLKILATNLLPYSLFLQFIRLIFHLMRVRHFVPCVLIPAQCIHIFVMNQAHVIPVFIFRGNSNVKLEFDIWRFLKIQYCSQTRSRILCIRKELSAHRFVKGVSNCVFQQSRVAILVICLHDQKVVVQVIRAISISRDHIPCSASNKRKLCRNTLLLQQLAGFLQDIRAIRTIAL